MLRRGLVFSGLLHVAILSLALVELPRDRQSVRHMMAPALAVDYVTIAERTAAPKTEAEPHEALSPKGDERTQPAEAPVTTPDSVPAPAAVRAHTAASPLAVKRTPVEGNTATADLGAAIKAQVEPCWSVPGAARDVQGMGVRIRIALAPDGSLARAPEILDAEQLTDPIYSAAAKSAARAIERCAPLKLPRDSYERWRSSTLLFNPKGRPGE